MKTIIDWSKGLSFQGQNIRSRLF